MARLRAGTFKGNQLKSCNNQTRLGIFFVTCKDAQALAPFVCNDAMHSTILGSDDDEMWNIPERPRREETCRVLGTMPLPIEGYVCCRQTCHDDSSIDTPPSVRNAKQAILAKAVGW